ncbi:MAG: hypothetical protein JNK91_00075 [Ferruginibacter sp.]|nr:hypothetical protein [Ferruginibacter sp.]
MSAQPIQSKGLQPVEINGELFYRIADTGAIRPFFMSIVSDSDHWLFLSSNGGISAGRKNTGFALFPYYTDDKITGTAETTGSKTIFRIHKNGERHTWEPFSVRSEARYRLQRNLYQNAWSNKIIFEEINDELGLAFQYEWNSSDRFGFVKHSRLRNLSESAIAIDVADGMQNLLPYGVPSDLQTKTSNLADAYKRTELEPVTGLGIFALSAIIVDKAEPSEALKANVAWGVGLENPVYLLSVSQLQAFRNGTDVKQETDIKGEPGAYFMVGRFSLAPAAGKQWMMAANVNQSQSDIVQLIETIRTTADMTPLVARDIEEGTKRLRALVGAADGMQCTADGLKDTRHFSNVLFNIMRGGVFADHYQVTRTDFENYLQKANKVLYESVAASLQTLAPSFSVFALRSVAAGSGNPDFIRLATEYLPLAFSRRHGDPSRPWNQFSINTRNETGDPVVLDYQGNWRDIFQNWEALAHAYPGFIEGMIYKFLNASTFDGYNPYRVSKDGFDWETIEPDNPWSYIGYWGDHQVIYLLKFLEFAEQRQPGIIDRWLPDEHFVYAHVPYRIKPYAEIVRNPKDTISFDQELDHRLRQRLATLGADGALLTKVNGDICRVSFMEKILAVLLSKLSNFIPEAGIWMNTQRPEWNDANNALVGNGVSMVTLYYLRRFLKFVEGVLQKSTHPSFFVSTELRDFFTNMHAALRESTKQVEEGITPAGRKKITDALGMAGSQYRGGIYARTFTGTKAVIPVNELLEFIDHALQLAAQSIRAGKRDDGLFHAYNLVRFHGNELHVSYLEEMLEGQVAALSTGALSATESLRLLDALRQSSLYRSDQNSYTLYPNKNLPGFLEKNNIPVAAAEGSKLLQRLLADGNTSVAEKDCKGQWHFNGNFRNAGDLKAALENLAPDYLPLAQAEENRLLELFEEIFHHRQFTGRSGTFFAYEGLGSIYWHMVSKLLLAIQETCLRAMGANEDPETIQRLVTHYYEVQEGIGVHKTPELYGAFPITPYSHTPLHKGAQQPGMTGQVKEDILCRIGELGIRLQNGRLTFDPVLLRRSEFLPGEKQCVLVDVNGEMQTIALEKNSLLFTCCQVPVQYVLGETESIELKRRNGPVVSMPGHSLTTEDSDAVLQRRGDVLHVKVFVQEKKLAG